MLSNLFKPTTVIKLKFESPYGTLKHSRDLHNYLKENNFRTIVNYNKLKYFVRNSETKKIELQFYASFKQSLVSPKNKRLNCLIITNKDISDEITVKSQKLEEIIKKFIPKV